MATTQVDTISFTGKSGRAYQFEMHGLQTVFNSVGGIYIWVKETQPGYFYPVYIGQSNDLKARHGNHEKEPCALRNGAVRICARACAPEAERLAIEKDLIQAYSPACNDIFT